MDDTKESPLKSRGSLLVTCLGVIEIVMLSLVGYFLSMLVGNNDTSNNMMKAVIPMLGILGGIIFLHTFLWFLYSQYNPLNMNNYFLMATSVSLLISLTALSIALVNKS